MNEEWRPVQGYEGRYEVSSLGRVRSLARDWTQPSRTGREHTHRIQARILKPGKTSVGYPSVALGRRGTRLVHRLVAEAFIGPAPLGAEVRHKDGSRDNNNILNLEYGSRKDNVSDARKHGTLYKAHDRARKIAHKDHDIIRDAYKKGATPKQIARGYGVCDARVHKILRCGL